MAAEYGGPAALALETAPLPAPGKGEVRVHVSATTATYTDLLVLRGSYIPKVRARHERAHIMPRLSMPVPPHGLVGAQRSTWAALPALPDAPRPRRSSRCR